MSPTRRPPWIDEGSPRPGRPLITTVENAAGLLRAAVEELCKVWVCTPGQFTAVWAPPRTGLGFVVPPTTEDATRRAAQCLVAEWAVGYALGLLKRAATLADGHAWFVSGGASKDLAIPSLVVPGIVPAPGTVAALLPYLLDFARPATRRDVLAGRAHRSARDLRKAQGVYLTPADAAQFMVEGVGRRSALQEGTWVDPAAGTGVFLRHVKATFESADVYGIDISPSASELAPFVLLATAFGSHASAYEQWRSWRGRFVTGDALMCRRRSGARGRGIERPIEAACNDTWLGAVEPWYLEDALPALEAGADVLIQNPPYAPPPPERRALLDRHYAGLSQNMYPFFLKAGMQLLRPGGAMAAVVPASIVNSSVKSIQDARAFIAESRGEVEIISFDRAPDGLFGDDVKTRASIVFCDLSGAESLRLGPMERLTSVRRSEQLIRGTSVIQPLDELRSHQPAKVGSEAELGLLAAVRTSRAHVVNYLRRVSNESLAATGGDDGHLVALAPTAYNWLSVHCSPVAAVNAGHDATNPFLVLRVESVALRDAVYAALNSRVAFWCWRVFGDGFHVNRSLLRQAPMPAVSDTSELRRLAKLGDELWQRCSAQPVVSRNAGRVSVAFPPGATPETLDLVSEIDNLLLDSMEVSDPRVNLSRWMRQIAAVGREDRRSGAVAWSEDR